MASSTGPKEIARFGITEAYSHPDANVDLILIHGLKGHPKDTWTADNGCFWPTELLPGVLKKLYNQIRVLVYGYHAHDLTHLGCGANNNENIQMLRWQSRRLIANLTDFRQNNGSKNPMIFVTHNLGGVILKDALIYSKDNGYQMDTFQLPTYGIIFLGIPYIGNDALKLAESLQREAEFFNSLEDGQINTFDPNTSAIRHSNVEFDVRLAPNIKRALAQEAVSMGNRGKSLAIAAENLLIPNTTYFEIEASHRDICKFENKNSSGFTNLWVLIKTWVMECPMEIQASLQTWNEMNRIEDKQLFVQSTQSSDKEPQLEETKEKMALMYSLYDNVLSSSYSAFVGARQNLHAKGVHFRDVTETKSKDSAYSPQLPYASEIGPSALQDCVAKRIPSSVIQLLANHFKEVAVKDFQWLNDLIDIGSTHEEIASLLISVEIGAPWIPQVFGLAFIEPAKSGFHQTNCVHTSGLKVTNTPRVRRFSEVEDIDTDEVRDSVSQTCGFAGILLTNDELDRWKVGESSISFTNELNSTALIRYHLATRSDFLSCVIDTLQRCLSAISILQSESMCCDSFTVIAINSFDTVELYRLEIGLIIQLWSCFKGFNVDKEEKISDWEIVLAFDKILNSFSIRQYLFDTIPYQLGFWNKYAMAVQIISLGVLCYSQGHTGKLHPSCLVDPVEEVHLLGTEDETSQHIVVKLVHLTCLGNMLDNPVLAFSVSNNDDIRLDKSVKYDLWASPEDLVDVWGPARFVTSEADPRSILAIEIGGGTVMLNSEESSKSHWKIGASSYQNCIPFTAADRMRIGVVQVNRRCPLNEDKSWRLELNNACIQHLGTMENSWELQEVQAGLQGGQYAVLQFNATYAKQNGITLKQKQLMLAFNEIDLAFLNSMCGLQISLCTGVARRVALRQLLADVMVPFVESRLQKPQYWEELKARQAIVENLSGPNIETWFSRLPIPLQTTVVQIIRSMLELLKDTGIDKNGEELVIAWVRKDSPYSCFKLRCEKTSLWARILADSPDCATFACITPLCLEIENYKCRNIEAAPWHNTSNLLDTAVCLQLSSRNLRPVTTATVPWQLQHEVSYWIGKSGTNMIAKVWLMSGGAEPRLLVKQKIIPEKYRSRMPKIMVERLGRLREKQASDAIARQVLVLTEI